MSPGVSASDRRVEKRLAARLRVEFKVGERVSEGHTADLSENGIFINTGWQAAPGSTVYMRLHLGPGEPVLKIVGAVRRSVRASKDQPPGLGIQFQVLYGSDRVSLKRFLSQSLGREIDEDSFGTVPDTGTFKFVFEPDTGEFEEEGILPSSTGPARQSREWPPKIARLDEAITAEEGAAKALRKAGLGGHAYTPKTIDDQYALRELNFRNPSRIFRKIVVWSISAGLIAGAVIGLRKMIVVFNSWLAR